MRAISHPSGLSESVVAKVVARRGSLHAFETLCIERTALVVIDLNTGSVAQDENCRAAVPRINAVAAAVRNHVGLVAWVTTAYSVSGIGNATYGVTTAARFASETSGDDGMLWAGLIVDSRDLHANKRGASAFFPGKCDLHDRLVARGTDTLLFAGTVTNVCVESSARDAVELGYKVTLISDACAGHANGLHEATLNTFYRNFGDVRPTADVFELISASSRLGPRGAQANEARLPSPLAGEGPGMGGVLSTNSEAAT